MILSEAGFSHVGQCVASAVRNPIFWRERCDGGFGCSGAQVDDCDDIAGFVMPHAVELFTLSKMVSKIGEVEKF